MNVRTDRKTDKPHELHVYVGLAQARPKYAILALRACNAYIHTCMHG